MDVDKAIIFVCWEIGPSYKYYGETATAVIICKMNLIFYHAI